MGGQEGCGMGKYGEGPSVLANNPSSQDNFLKSNLKKKKSLCILCFVISGRHFPIAHLKWNRPTKAPVRQLQHLLVHWDLNKNHAGVFIHMSKQTNQQNLGRQYLTKRTLIIPKQYTPFQEPKKQRRVSLSAAGKRELFRWRACSCCIIHRAEVCSSESLKWSRCKRVHLVVKRVSCLRCQGMEEFH